MQIDFFIFDAPPQPLDEDIVQRAAPAIHTDPNPASEQSVCKGSTGKLHALIRIENLRLSQAERPFQSAFAEFTVERDRNFPTQDVAREPIHDRDQIDKPVEQADVSDVARPDLRRARNLKAAQQVRVNPMSW